ncbi:RluA family pseudouridine synthase [Ponticaulis sp.]|uniref:RluA family pseudouridine synthase n=1 Tax=Ponticaulis sp. TaxID=2020902 RepID=UPI000B70F87F|nr:RluA family pseudouridine synthase [Ponticaulis sp.]MAI90083.1 RNA pseudouridine synthase [Ponticaulis sp.]OUX99739.1 MAG: RNA pseudouridine synthase [Hyphomonadaceae bacterium TMED5]|tara:strand:+ start:42150 stop:42812 length:663 start_codon:yes stop_codon:yes gene_type:complete
MSAPLIYHPPATDPLPVLYEDEALLVVDKPSGLLSVPGRLELHKDSLILRLQTVYSDALTVHRLDMDTSGLMIYARSKEVHRALSMAFERKQVEKRYLALVWGRVAQDEGEVDLPLIKDWPNRPRHMVDHENGKPSRTLWRVVERFENTTLVELTPVTGRTHQLRIHMAEIGHGILGDCWYGSEDSMAAHERLCLHASQLSFEHPATKKRVTFESDAPFL